MMRALWAVLEERLTDRQYIGGDYSIADIAAYPWINYFEPRETINAFPNLRRWRDAVAARRGVRAVYARVAALDTGYALNDKGMSLFDWDGVVRNVITV